MARARSVHVDIDPWPLLRGRLDVTRIALDKPELLLERNARGQANWRFDRKRPKRSSTTIRALSIRDGTLRVREPALHTDLKLAVETERRDAKDGYAPIVARGTGRYRNEPFDLDGRLDSPLQLLRRGEGYRLDLRAHAGDTKLHAHGKLDSPIDLTRYRKCGRIGPDLADLYRLLGIATPKRRLQGLRPIEREQDVGALLTSTAWRRQRRGRRRQHRRGRQTTGLHAKLGRDSSTSTTSGPDRRSARHRAGETASPNSAPRHRKGRRASGAARQTV